MNLVDAPLRTRVTRSSRQTQRHTHTQTAIPSEGNWGLRNYDTDPGVYVLESKTNTQFFDAFDALMGS
jgi:hypothetical protein